MSSLHRFAPSIPTELEWIVLGFLDPFEFYSHLVFGGLLAELEVSVPTAVAKEILKFAYKDPKNPDCLLVGESESKEVLPIERAYWRDYTGEEVKVLKLFSTENVNLARYLSLTPTSWLRERDRFPFKEFMEEADDLTLEGPNTKILRFVMRSTTREDLTSFLFKPYGLNEVRGKALEEAMVKGYQVCWDEKKSQ